MIAKERKSVLELRASPVQSVLRMAKLEDILEAFQTNIREEKMKRT